MLSSSEALLVFQFYKILTTQHLGLFSFWASTTVRGFENKNINMFRKLDLFLSLGKKVGKVLSWASDIPIPNPRATILS